MALRADETETLVRECRPFLIGARVDHVHQSGDDEVILSFYGRDTGKRFLLFSVHPDLTRFHLIAVRPRASSEPSTFCLALRRQLKGGHVLGVAAAEGGRAMRLAVSPPGEGRAEVVLELRSIGRKPQLSCLSATGEVLHALTSSATPSPAVELTSKDMMSGSASPSAAGPHSEADGGAASAEPTRPDVNVTASVPTPDAGLPPHHAAVMRRFERVAAPVLLAAERLVISRRLKKERKRRERLLTKVRTDRDRAQAGEEARRFGELLKPFVGKIKRGVDFVDLPDYSVDGVATVRVPLDPTLTPQQNLERYFKRYRKSKRGLPIILERLGKLEAEQAELRGLAAELEDAASTAALDSLRSRLESLCRPPRHRGTGKSQEAAVAGPKRFVSADQLEILVGRNQRSNDELSTRIARGNDMFLHVSGRPGAHVIVRLQKGQVMPQETLLDAATLAVYFSSTSRARSQLQDGAGFDVDYTAAKYVRKPKGAAPGLVLLAQHKTIRLRFEMVRLQRLTDAPVAR